MIFHRASAILQSSAFSLQSSVSALQIEHHFLFFERRLKAAFAVMFKNRRDNFVGRAVAWLTPTTVKKRRNASQPMASEFHLAVIAISLAVTGLQGESAFDGNRYSLQREQHGGYRDDRFQQEKTR